MKSFYRRVSKKGRSQNGFEVKNVAQQCVVKAPKASEQDAKPISLTIEKDTSSKKYDMDGSPNSYLTQLPVEILDLILNHVEAADLACLRLVSTDLERTLVDAFGRVCLDTIRTNLSRESMEKLSDLGRCEKFKLYPRRLLLRGTCDFGNGWGHDYAWIRHGNGYLDEPLSTQAGSTLRRLLLDDLVNCRSFGLLSYSSENETKESINDNDNVLTPGDAVGIVLAIIADTGLHCKSFELDSSMKGWGALNEQRLDMDRYLTPLFMRTWANVECLHFRQTLNRRIGRGRDGRWHTDLPGMFAKLLELSKHATNLESLTLALEGRQEGCSASAFVNKILSLETANALVDLHLDGLILSCQQIVELLSRSGGTLVKLSFERVTCCMGTWAHVFHNLIRNNNKVRQFSVLNIRQHYTMLTSMGQRVIFDLPNATEHSWVSGPIKFELQRGTRSYGNDVVGVKYNGDHMSEALEYVSNAAVFDTI